MTIFSLIRASARRDGGQGVVQGRELLLRVALTVLVAMGTAASSVGCQTARGQAAGGYSDVAERYFEEAQDDFQSGDYIEAIRRYNLVRTKFPYSRFAALAELRIADAYFEQQKLASAVEQYRLFIQMHPTHPKVVYANWRIAESYYEQMPEDWWFMPPSFERDLTSSRDAERELRGFVNRYPKSEYTAEAEQRLKRVMRRLADHEMYVAQFYLKRDNPRAAALRLLYLLRSYPHTGLDPEALFLLARASLEIGDSDRAKRALEDLVKYYPQTGLADKARAYMEQHKL